MNSVPIPGTPNSQTDLNLPVKPPKQNLDSGRFGICKHGHRITPKRVNPAFRGHGYWQNFAEDCSLCDGSPSGIPYKPAENLKRRSTN